MILRFSDSLVACRNLSMAPIATENNLYYWTLLHVIDFLVGANVEYYAYTGPTQFRIKLSLTESTFETKRSDFENSKCAGIIIDDRYLMQPKTIFENPS